MVRKIEVFVSKKAEADFAKLDGRRRDAVAQTLAKQSKSEWENVVDTRGLFKLRVGDVRIVAVRNGRRYVVRRILPRRDSHQFYHQYYQHGSIREDVSAVALEESSIGEYHRGGTEAGILKAVEARFEDELQKVQTNAAAVELHLEGLRESVALLEDSEAQSRQAMLRLREEMSDGVTSLLEVVERRVVRLESEQRMARSLHAKLTRPFSQIAAYVNSFRAKKAQPRAGT